MGCCTSSIAKRPRIIKRRQENDGIADRVSDLQHLSIRQVR